MSRFLSLSAVHCLSPTRGTTKSDLLLRQNCTKPSNDVSNDSGVHGGRRRDTRRRGANMHGLTISSWHLIHGWSQAGGRRTEKVMGFEGWEESVWAYDETCPTTRDPSAQLSNARIKRNPSSNAQMICVSTTSSLLVSRHSHKRQHDHHLVISMS